MVRRSSAALAAVAALAGLALAGCSATDDANVAPTTSVVTTATPSSSPTESLSPSPRVTDVADGTLDQNVLAQAITSNLNDSLGAEITLDVVCPPGVAIKQGAVSSCSALLDGQALEFTVTQADTEGNVDFEPTAAVLDVAKLQTETAAQYGQQKGGAWTAACGAAGTAYLVQSVGATFECTFTSSTGETKPFTVTVTDLDGNISWAEN